MSTQLIREYDLRLATPECSPESVWYRVSVDLQDDIAGALPYLKAELKGIDYQHSAGVLLWIADGIRCAFRAREIVIAPVGSRDEAQRGLVDRIVDTVNDVWNRRDQIEPDPKGRKALANPLDIYRLLPGTNCGECGFPTCMAFATALRADSTKLLLCCHLSEEDHLRVLPQDTLS